MVISGWSSAAVVFHSGAKVFNDHPTTVEQRRRSAATTAREAVTSSVSSSTALSMIIVAMATTVTSVVVREEEEDEESKIKKFPFSKQEEIVLESENKFFLEMKESDSKLFGEEVK